MAEQELKIKISVDQDTGKLKVIKTDLDLIAQSAGKAAKSAAGFRSAIDLIAHGTQALIGTAQIMRGIASQIDAVTGAGIRYNAQMEQTQLALKATLSGYIDAATGAERIAKANALATTQMDRLKAASAETGIDFNELATAFKTFLPGALSVGMSLDQATKSATRLTQAAKIQGVEFNALLAGIDGVARGTILANSDFGRFLGGIGLTNEALKEATKTSQTYALIMQKTADIPAVAATGANNYNTALADLNKTIEELRGEMTKPMFEAMIEGMQEFNKFLKDNKELIKSLPSAIGSLTKSVVIFGASLWAINRGVKAFELLKVAFASGAAAIKTARASMVTLEGAYSAASVRAGVLATAQRALGARS